MTRTFEQIGTELGQLVARKNAAYGSSFAKSGAFLRLLFPEGVPPERLEDALLLVRIFDKQMRIATARDAFGESPWQDIAGYGLLGTQLHEERKQQECASVRQQDVGEESTEPNDSADRDASRPTIANAAEKNEKPSRPPSPQPSATTSASTDVVALIAMEGVFASLVALVRRHFSRGRFQSQIPAGAVRPTTAPAPSVVARRHFAASTPAGYQRPKPVRTTK